MENNKGWFSGTHNVLNQVSDRLLYTEQYAIELTLTLASLWGSWVFFHPPSNFEMFPGSYRFLIAINNDENFWGALLLIGALLKFLGLNLCIVYHKHGVGLFCRIVGLAISGFFWPLFGLSSFTNNPDTLTGVPIGIVGIGAWWTLLRFPWMPSRVR